MAPFTRAAWRRMAQAIADILRHEVSVVIVHFPDATETFTVGGPAV